MTTRLTVRQYVIVFHALLSGFRFDVSPYFIDISGRYRFHQGPEKRHLRLILST
jgi:hypothetical protein